MSLVNLKSKSCKQAPGTEVEILLAIASDVINDPRTVAQIGASVQTYSYADGDGVTIGEAFQYRLNDQGATVGKWYRARIVSDSGELTTDTVGEKGFKAFENGFKGMIKGMDTAVREWVERATMSCDGVIAAIPNRTTGDYEILGTIGSPLDITFKGSSGKKPGDKYGFDFEIKDSSGRVYRTYPKALGLNIAPAA